MHFTTDIRTIYLGHIDELHYVSTVPFNFVPMPMVSNTVLVMSETNSTLSKENNSKRKNNAYIGEYRKKKKKLIKTRRKVMHIWENIEIYEKRQNYNAYMREYRASKPSEQNNYLPQVNDEKTKMWYQSFTEL